MSGTGKAKRNDKGNRVPEKWYVCRCCLSGRGKNRQKNGEMAKMGLNLGKMNANLVFLNAKMAKTKPKSLFLKKMGKK